MKKPLLIATAVLVAAAPVLVLAFAPAPDAGSHAVEYKRWNGYAESRESGLKGETSFLALTAKSEFARLFDPVLTPRGAPDAVPPSAFDKNLFVAVIKRGNVLWEYKVEKVTANGDTLTVSYRATPRGSATARAEPRRLDTGPVRVYATLKDSDVRGATVKVEAIRETARAVRVVETKKTVAETKVETKKVEAVPLRGETKKVEAAPRIETRKTEVEYVTTMRARTADGGSFDSPLILSVPKDKYSQVIFIEDGHKAGTVRLDR